MKNTIITIGGSKEFTDYTLAEQEINKVIRSKRISKSNLLVYGFEDSHELAGAYSVAKAWADKNNVKFASGQIKDGPRDTASWKKRKEERDNILTDVSKLIINLRVGSYKNGGKDFLSLAESKNVPVVVVDSEPNAKDLTPVQRRKGDVPDIEDVKKSVAIYSKVAQNLLEMRSVTLDLETTGIGKEDEAVEIAIGDNYSGTIIYESLIKPSIPISPEASKVNGITAKMLKDAPTIDQIWDVIDALVGNRIVVASHSVSGVKCFDQRLLNQSLAKHGKYCGFLFFDLQPLYRLYSCQHSERDYPLRTDGMALQLGIKAGGHRAVGDVISQINILQAMAQGIMPNFDV